MPALLETKNLIKIYPGVTALNQVDFQIMEGEIHALMGENGAGKSTLVKVITGVTKADAGEMFFNGTSIMNISPAEIRDLGISVIFQDANLIPNLSVAENIYLTRMPTNNGLINKPLLYESARRILKEMDLDFSEKTRVEDLSSLNQKMVAVARSLSFEPKLIIMDEPTAALSRNEINILFEKIHFLKSRGVSVLYISHFLEEVFEIADRITVIRDGKKIQTAEVRDVTPEVVVFMMVGHKVDVQAHSDEYSIEPDPILTVDKVSYKPFLEDISFALNKGEILGITGPAGSGKTAIARLIFGVDHPDKGSISVRSGSSSFRQPAHAIRAGIGYVPQNRHGEGVLLADPIIKNVSLPSLNKISWFGFINKPKEKDLSLAYIRKLAIKASSYNMQVQNLSGGNQQKVSIAKWLALNPEVLILDEPTQGIDVNTKQEIYQLIIELARTGVSIVLISSEPAELAQLSDRVAIIRRGKIVNYLNGASITRENIIKEVTGAKETSSNHEYRSES